MTPRAKIAAFIAVLATSFGAGTAIGAAVGPIDVGPDDPSHDVHLDSDHEGHESQAGR